MERLTKMFVEVCEEHLDFRDYTRHELRAALEEAIACFPVYRTYVGSSGEEVGDEDAAYIHEAIAAAGRNRPDVDAGLFDFLHDILLLQEDGVLERSLAMRFQQTTAAATAKGVEDTFFYRYNRFMSLNEVGGDPTRFGIPVEEFHRRMIRAHQRWPRSMLSTSTHDTKRSEDVRARLALLSEIPDRWTAAVRRWMAMNERHRRDDLPDRNMEYLLYQTLVGSWPLSVERANAYMNKAAREAKAHTSWIDPVPAYEAALGGFVERVLMDEAFVAEMDAFVRPLVEPGWVNSLSQVLLKLTCPGVPDLYQGTELWDLSLVDPDNRRPIDFAVRRDLLGVAEGSPEDAWKRADEGAPKLYLIRRVLGVRKRLPEAFGPLGDYRPMLVRGHKAAHVVAFMRGGDVVVVAPRLVVGVGTPWGGGILDIEAQKAWTDWGDTIVDWDEGDWLNELTDEEFTGSTLVSSLFERFPVALLTRMA